jgi:ArsR family transcriptional regulator, nickel/cobalt-responsive transcriptional repressor
MARDASDQRNQAEWLAGTTDPTRLVILRVLATGTKTVTELAKACGTEITNVSHHLNRMKGIGLVVAEREGRFMRYSLVGATATATLLGLTHEAGITVTIPLGWPLARSPRPDYPLPVPAVGLARRHATG